MKKDGTMDDFGIPASIVAGNTSTNTASWLRKPVRTTCCSHSSVSVSIRLKRWSLLRALTDFKRAFDLNPRVKNMLPSLYREDPEFL
ncbi:hypothetical protein LNP74_03845 [Klebsiella pneumoniae subsp. pneumoniae]|nr:hypothetical protein [Klebsiella pneumoniae subsp. pneumoniae]